MDESEALTGFRTAGIPMVVIDAEGRVVHANPAANELLGYGQTGLLNLHIADFLSVRSVAEFNSLVIPPANFAVTRVNGRAPSGQQIPLTAHTTVWTDPLKGVHQTLFLGSIAADLDVERLDLRELTLSNNATREAQIGVFEYNPITDTVVVSKIWRELLELTPADVMDVQLEWRGRVHPDDLSAALEPIRICVENSASRASCEYRLRSRDGSMWRWMRTDVGIAERDEAGKPIRLIGAMTDVTERKQIEEELRLSVSQFKSAFDEAPIGKAIIAPDGTFLRSNPALLRFFGYSDEELMQKTFQMVTHPDDLSADLAQLDMLKVGKISSYQMEKRYIRADGAIIWGLLSVAMVSDSNGLPEHFISQIVDITEERQLRDLKSEFVAVVSHELRTPLTSILGSLALLSSMEDESMSDDVQRLLFIAQQNGQRLLHLVNDVLDFEKLSNRQMTIRPSRQFVAQLLDEALLTNLASADTYKVRFALTCPDRTITGFVDPSRFQQIMTNLLSNAAKFATEGSTINILAESQATMVRVSVSNVGPQIPAEFRDQVFKPFSQAANAITRKRGGTGLGLSITKQVVEQMGGKIGFESPKGKRTTFWFTIPVDGPSENGTTTQIA